jgi:hypothetical protein
MLGMVKGLGLVPLAGRVPVVVDGRGVEAGPGAGFTTLNFLGRGIRLAADDRGVAGDRAGAAVRDGSFGGMSWPIAGTEAIARLPNSVNVRYRVDRRMGNGFLPEDSWTRGPTVRGHTSTDRIDPDTEGFQPVHSLSASETADPHC